MQAHTEDHNLALLDFWPDGPKLEAYYQDWTPYSLIMGPYGSAKTKTTAVKCLDIICDTPPGKDGVRRSKGLVTRNYEADLKTTTIRDFIDVLPGGIEALGDFKQTAPIEITLDFIGSDGIPVHAIVHFLPLEDENEARKKLKGQEYTWAWFNEASEMRWSIVQTALGRLGRYPKHSEMPNIPINHYGDRYWYGAFFDSNACDDEHWMYQIIETPTEEQQKLWSTYRQPGGVIKDPATGKWLPNPDAENLANLSPSYYQMQIANAGALGDDWIKINLANEYGATINGKPVWPEYSQMLHETDAIDFIPGMTVYAGQDYGRTPSMVLAQERPGGGYIIFDEYPSDDMSASTFGENLAKYLLRTWGVQAKDVVCWDDPAGKQKGQGTEHSARQTMHEAGFVQMQPAPCDNNDLTIRRTAVARPLKRICADGFPAFLVHKRVKVLRKGGAGKFYYRKMVATYDDMYTETPVKNFYSHTCFAPGTLIETPLGDVAIETLSVGDFVNTPLGPRRIAANWQRDTQRIQLNTTTGNTICTPDHPIHTAVGYVPAGLLEPGDRIACNNPLWNNHWRLRRNVHRLPSTISMSFRESVTTVAGILTTITRRQTTMLWSTCIEQFGNATTDRYPKNTTSITLMAIKPTTGLKISSVYRHLNMLACTRWSRNGLQKAKRLSKLRVLRLFNGVRRIPKKLGRLGCVPPPGLMRNANPLRTLIPSVDTAEKQHSIIHQIFFERKPMASDCIAAKTVYQPQGVHEGLITSSENAECADQISQPTNTERKTPVVVRVQESWDGPVVGIEVEDAHAYYANGMLVSNCEAAEYLMVGMGEGQAFVDPELSRETQSLKTQKRSRIPSRRHLAA